MSDNQIQIKAKAFPKDLEYRVGEAVNKQLLWGFIILFVVLGGLTFGLSFRKVSNELTKKDILKIKERYARLELEKPKEDVVVKKEEKGSEKKAVEKVKPKEEVKENKEAPKVSNRAISDMPKTEREVRKFETQEARTQTRQALREEIAQGGLFAELTAVGDVSDNTYDDVLALGDVKDISEINLKSTQFTKKPSAPKVLEKKGTRIQSEGIGQQKIEKAEVKQIEVEAEIKMTAPQKIEGAASGEESRSARSVEKVIGGIQANIKTQFEKYLRQDPTLSGKVEVEFVILANGQVTGVRVVKSSLDNSAFERRLISMIGRLQFAPASSDITITYPFVFAALKV